MNSEKILKTYQSEGSLRETARKLNISACKVKKALITLGEYETMRTKEIAKLRQQGMSYEEIAETLNITKSCVFANTPYEKGMYNSDTPTANAMRIRKCKEKKLTAIGKK